MMLLRISEGLDFARSAPLATRSRWQAAKQRGVRRAVDFHILCSVTLKNAILIFWRIRQHHVNETATDEIRGEHLTTRHHHRPQSPHTLAFEPSAPDFAPAWSQS